MLEIQRLRNEKDLVIQGLKSRNIGNASAAVEGILELDDRRKEAITRLEALQRDMNQVSKSIGQLMKNGKKEEAEQAKSQTQEIRGQIKSYEKDVQDTEQSLHEELIKLPNIPHNSVPVGMSERDNVVAKESDHTVTFDFKPLPHWDLATKHSLISWELGVKLTGSGFPVYIGKGAQLQRALISYFLTEATRAGYVEIQPPLVVNEASGYATGQLPDKEGQMYYIGKDDLYLIPTAEVPITNLYRNQILAEADLPIKHCGYTPCFRREAGSYGKDVKGLNRLHQFDKVEIVQVTHPARSYDTLEAMTQHVAGLLEALALPYRQLILCTGDATFTSAKTYDMEVFSAGQERWLEVSSISNFETFQANRLKLRYRDEKKKRHICHTLNGSALALPRILAALLENNQQADGSILIPEVLQPYTGFKSIA
ncbi:MAG: serine--tRNA ligase [Bacteroidota bacterium]